MLTELVYVCSSGSLSDVKESYAIPSYPLLIEVKIRIELDATLHRKIIVLRYYIVAELNFKAITINNVCNL